jgi:hypothetical protein
MPRASLRSFLLRKPACSAAAAGRASMQITGQPCRCSPAHSLVEQRIGQGQGWQVRELGSTLGLCRSHLLGSCLDGSYRGYSKRSAGTDDRPS